MQACVLAGAMHNGTRGRRTHLGMSSDTMSSSTDSRMRQNMSTTPSPCAVAAMRSWKNVGQCAGYSYWRGRGTEPGEAGGAGGG